MARKEAGELIWIFGCLSPETWGWAPAVPQGDLSRLEASAAHAGELFQGAKWHCLAH